MNDYFRLPRRKAGVVMLIVACLFAAGWTRSSSTQDTLTVFFSQSFGLKLVSTGQRLILVKIHNKSNEPLLTSFWESEPSRADAWIMRLAGSSAACSGANGVAPSSVDLGFGNMHVRANWHSVPYWAVVPPITLLAAWLLLSKPRIAAAGPRQVN